MDREKETVILEKLSQNREPIKQRELAEIAGLSLGMTNALLKRMVDKGLLMMEKVNSRNIKYILTSQGHRELNSRIKNYMKGTIKNVVYYREAIEELVRKSSDEGYRGICLMGKSDLDFILEWACHHYRMDFMRDESPAGFLTVYSEKGSRDLPGEMRSDSVDLSDLGVQYEVSR